jgi:hypothetical protein
MVVLLWSPICTVLVDPLPATHALDHIAHFVQFTGFAKPVRFTFLTRSGKASLLFLSSHETLYSSCTKSPKGYFSSILNARNELTSQMYLLIHKPHRFKDLYRSLLFLKWTTRNRWSNIGNYNQRHFSFHQRLDGTISHVQAPVVSQGNYAL